jgi:hypothetical protein
MNVHVETEKRFNISYNKLQFMKKNRCRSDATQRRERIFMLGLIHKIFSYTFHLEKVKAEL